MGPADLIDADHLITDSKALSTLRARLALAGGYRLEFVNGGRCGFVVLHHRDPVLGHRARSNEVDFRLNAAVRER